MKERKTLQFIRLLVVLLVLVPAAFADAGGKSEKEQLNEKFRAIGKEMEEFYNKGDVDKVLDLFHKHCIKDEEMEPMPKPGKKRDEFRRVAREIRHYIYRLVAFSYFALNKPTMGDIYLRKLSKSQLNKAFRIIAGEMTGHYDNGRLNDVINLYRERCCKRKKGDDKKAKPAKEKKVFKKAAKDIRADIYQLVALSYDDLDETKMRDIYLKKLLDIRLHLESDIYRESWREIVKKKYIVLPRLLLGVKAGINFTMPHIGQRYSILKPALSKDYSYDLAHILGAQLAGVLEYTLTKNLSLCMEVNTISLEFRYNNILEWENTDENQGAAEVEPLSFIHHHRVYFIELPFLLKHRFVNSESKFAPYLQMGGYLRFLQFANKEIESSLEADPDGNTKTISFKDQINRFNSGFCVGAGIGYDTKFMGFDFRLEFEVNYKHGFNNIVNEDRRYTNKELVPFLKSFVSKCGIIKSPFDIK